MTGRPAHRGTGPRATGRRLRPYQETAVANVETGLAGGGLGQIHLACGTGKTMVCLRGTETLLTGGGLAVVLAPTLALVAQLLHEWRAHAITPFTALAVCSDDTVTDAPVHLGDLGTQSTTDSDTVTAWLTTTSGRRRYVFGTYASAHAVATALRSLSLRADLLVCDEAHHLTGRPGAAIRRVLDHEFLPAHRRLFATATPRDDLRRDATAPLYGMDDETLFGPRLAYYPLHEAIADGWLKDYRVAIIGVTEDQARALLTDDEVDYLDPADSMSLRTLATQIALATACRRHGIRRAISFHHTVSDAQDFARSLPRTLARMPARQRPPGPGEFVAVHAGHTTLQRSMLLDHLRHPPEDGWTVVSNARVLGEGVDIPAVDAVAFAHPRKSPVSIIQAIGRALRGTAEPGTIATIVVPIIVPATADETAVADLDPRDYAALWNILRALRAHDDRLAADLDHARENADPRDYRLPDRISVTLPPGAADHVLAQLTLLTVHQTTSPWTEGLGAARRYHAKFGDLLVPQDFVDVHGFRLGRWIHAQRHSVLTTGQTAALDALGMVWNVFDARWERMFTLAAAFHHAHGHLRLGSTEVVDGENLGAWLVAQRKADRRGTLDPGRRERLTAIGMWWGAFATGLDACDRYLATHGDLDVPAGFVDGEGYPLGRWLAAQKSRNNGTGHPLDPGERAALDSRGILWSKRGRPLTTPETMSLRHIRDQGTSAELNTAIASLVAAGVTQRSIARTLNLSPTAVRKRLHATPRSPPSATPTATAADQQSRDQPGKQTV
ncbi:hypothetical protein CFP71_27930 [Amycolatopsis thailandensis]|uniref:Helicase n=1 Tax=Amycolatopsis thailandensis TaxID=589330 RepID=A0A229RUE8_9PSEU|nr:DEAD/DEAH box helicase [Amycolatopsis thailandensis]OXM50266.1 hypothetical protein CFP71_27930 [Amycolatopsis thailandensis]